MSLKPETGHWPKLTFCCRRQIISDLFTQRWQSRKNSAEVTSGTEDKKGRDPFSQPLSVSGILTRLKHSWCFVIIIISSGKNVMICSTTHPKTWSCCCFPYNTPHIQEEGICKDLRLILIFKKITWNLLISLFKVQSKYDQNSSRWICYLSSWKLIK